MGGGGEGGGIAKSVLGHVTRCLVLQPPVCSFLHSQHNLFYASFQRHSSEACIKKRTALLLNPRPTPELNNHEVTIWSRVG